MTILYSEQAQTTDFITIKGIRTRLGLDKKDLDVFVIRELLDNALDFIDSNTKEFIKLNKTPYIHLIVSEEENGKVTKITVRNSNPLVKINDVFSEDQIEKIFNYDNYYSSKRNQYRLSRGALGGAFKDILGITYALAVEDPDNNNDIKEYEDWKYPLQINISNKRLIDVRIEIVDKIRKKIQSKIDPKNIELVEVDKNEPNNNNNDNEYTEITIYIPKKLNHDKISLVFREYATINTHIEFRSKLSNIKFSPTYTATQDIKDWGNKQSIYYYSLNEFKDLIRSFESNNDSLNVYDELIHTDFREGYTLGKSKEFETLTFGELKRDDSKIENIYKLLKDNVDSIGERKSTSSRDLTLPFDIKQNVRSKALCERFEEVFAEIDSFAYKRIDGYFRPEEGGGPNNTVEFPFMLEIFLVESSEYEKRLSYFPSVNLSPSMYSDSLDDEDRNSKIFSFIPGNKKNNLNQLELLESIEYAYGITDILHKCGYYFDKKKHRRSINFVFVNLISPRIDYKTGGKINLELKPFKSISQELYKFCKLPNIKDKTNKKNERSNSIKQELKNLIYEERVFEIEEENLDVKDLAPWTQSTTFYTLRPILIAKGYRDVDKKRKYITSEIKKVCKELGYKRHELGIIAAERAQLYFDNQVLGVSFNQLEELMKKGTDLLVIEKEGVADVLMDFANRLGIAILNTRGFLTEYAEELSELAENEGCNIAVLTDWDSSGLVISSKLPNAYRIGIDPKTLEKFGLRKEDVEEKVQQKKEVDNHLKNLKKLSQNQIPSPYTISEWKEMIKYLEGRKRIEIDSVLAEVGSKKFWNFVMKELDSIFPERNYNRSIKVPDHVLPTLFEKFNESVIGIVSEIQAPKRTKKREELGKIEGFLEVKLKTEEIKEDLRSDVETDDVKNKISEEFKKLFN